MSAAPDRAGLVAAARSWLAGDPDPGTRAELAGLLDRVDDPGALAELADRFRGRLEFGTAGLRGALGAGPNRMNRVTVRQAAAGVARWLGPGRTVVIGYDARRLSDVFATDTAAVLTGAGLRAVLLPRPLPTPVLAFAVRHLRAGAGVMVTASHNPPRDNGYKVYLDTGGQIVPPVDARISAAIAAAGPVAELPLGTGWDTAGDEIVEAYLDALAALPLGTDRDVTVAYTPLHGVGRDTLLAAFARAGFPDPVVVAEQGDPDPDFPTVAFPNPEEPGAMDLVLAAGERAGTDLVLANDPDADRCAVAVGGRLLTGDELGGLLAEHVLRHTGGTDRLVVTTIVSSSLLRAIARAFDVRYAETLTGFKWIVRAATEQPPEGVAGAEPSRLVFGYEEALGYCVGGDGGPPVFDKDGIGAALAVAALAAEAKAAGTTLLDLLDDQARRYGVHATRQVSVRVADAAAPGAVMARLRAAPPDRIGGIDVLGVDDLEQGMAGLPPTDGLRFQLAGDARVVIRPSGTEPKLKAYAEVVVEVTGDDVAAARARAGGALDALAADLEATLTGADRPGA